MKKLLFVILFFAQHIVAQKVDSLSCPLTGNAGPKNIRLQNLNILKNRVPKPEKIDTSVTIQKIFQEGNDTGRFKSSQYVSITGYLYKMKPGGIEGCNCKSTDNSYEDYHLEVIVDSNVDDVPGTSIMICEVTWRSRNADSALTWDNIKSMVGQKVTIQGYMFFDAEHWQNSENTCNSCTDVWRCSAWEIHPITFIFLTN